MSGVQTAGCINCSVAGTTNGNGQYGYYEAPPSLNTALSALKAEGNGTAPVLLQSGSGGVYESGGNVQIAQNGATKFTVGASLTQTNNSINGSNGNGPSLFNVSAGAAAPTLLPNKNDSKAGVGAYASGAVSVSADVSGTATEMHRFATTGVEQRFVPELDQSVVSTVLTSSGYTVPAGTDYVRLKPTAAVTATITLPTPVGDAQPITFECYTYACTLSFSPAVSGWTNGTVLAANGKTTFVEDVAAGAWQHKAPQ